MKLKIFSESMIERVNHNTVATSKTDYSGNISLPCQFAPVCRWVRLVFMLFSFNTTTIFCCPPVLSKHEAGSSFIRPVCKQRNSCLQIKRRGSKNKVSN